LKLHTRKTDRAFTKVIYYELCDGLRGLVNLKGPRRGRSIAQFELPSRASHEDTEENQDDAWSG